MPSKRPKRRQGCRPLWWVMSVSDGLMTPPSPYDGDTSPSRSPRRGGVRESVSLAHRPPRASTLCASRSDASPRGEVSPYSTRRLPRVKGLLLVPQSGTYARRGARRMIVSFRDEWLKGFFVDDVRSRNIPSDLESRLFRKLQMIDDATTDQDLRVPPSNHFEKLRGNLAGFHSIRVNRQWRRSFDGTAAAGRRTASISTTMATDEARQPC